MGFTFIVAGVLCGLASLCLLALVTNKHTVQRSNGSENTVDTSKASVQAQISAKARLRRAHPSTANPPPQGAPIDLPPGQKVVKQWIVLDLGIRPTREQYNPADPSWRLQVTLQSQAQVELSLDDLKALGLKPFTVDWHCVTGWTARGVQFQGVPLASVLDACGCSSTGWTWLMQCGADGYSAPVHKDDLADAFVALTDGEGAPLPTAHGGVRIVCPQLFGWKSCKWLQSLQLGQVQQRGFWEKLGCHERGRWRLNERWAPAAHSVWTVLIACLEAYYWIIPQSAVVILMQRSAAVLGWVSQKLQVLGAAQGGKQKGSRTKQL